jgi:NAD(P)-dependent dehydrogenase (short-subunit alcohol dehydrogenase family)
MARPQVVLVTGCTTGGIGWHLASQLAARGATVYASARRLAAMEGLAAKGCRLVQLDVTKPETIKAAVDKIVGENGRIDGE